MAFSPDGKLVVLGSFDGFVTSLHTATGGEAWASSEPAQPVNGVRFSPDGTLLALALGHTSKGAPGDPNEQWGEVEVWHWPSPKLLATLGLSGETRQCKSVAFSPDSTLLAATGDPTTRLYDPVSFRQKAVLTSGPFSASLSFRPDGKLLATGNESGKVILWDLATTLPRASFQAHTMNIPSLADSPDGKTLATGSADGTIKLWDVSETALAAPAGNR
jgi:WD40 repeat protein